MGGFFMANQGRHVDLKSLLGTKKYSVLTLNVRQISQQSLVSRRHIRQIGSIALGQA